MTEKEFINKQGLNNEPVNTEVAMEAPSHHGVDILDQSNPAVTEFDPVNDSDLQIADLDVDNANEPQNLLVAMTAERNHLKDQLLRAMADTENMRRRSERESANVRKYGHTPFARDLVGAIDNLARAVESTPHHEALLDETFKSIITGIQLSWTELQSVIEKHGIKRIEPLGEKFDYNLHQAMFEVPTEEEVSGIVLEVVQHGYVLHDRLLRPAMVGVSKAIDLAADQQAQSKTV